MTSSAMPGVAGPTFLDRFCRVLDLASALALAVMVAMVFGNVVLRYAFNSGIAVSEELSRWLFVWMTFMGAVVALKEHGHLGSDMLVSRLSRTGKRVCMAASQLLMLGCTVMLLQGRAGPELDVGQWEPYDQAIGSTPSASEALDAVISQVKKGGEERLIGRTQLLIAPGYPFQFTDALVTNFHQPGSTLLLLVAAFIGPSWRKVYEHALATDYRFLSYGDASLLFRTRS